VERFRYRVPYWLGVGADNVTDVPARGLIAMRTTAEIAGGPPIVAVCVVTYNHAAYIADCLTSVLSQQVDAVVQIWVGDDMSTDGTSEIVANIAKAWPGRVHHLLHTSRLGPIGNYRAIIEAAEGDFIAHLDGDDLWLPGKLREQLAVLAAAPACSASCTNALVFDDSREPVGWFSNATSGPFDMAALLRRGNFLNHSSLVYRAEFRDRILALPPPFIDYRMHLALSAAGPILYTSKPFVGYRLNAAGSMLRRDNEAVRHQYFEAIEQALPLVPPKIRAEACADFVRRVFFRSLSLRRPALLTQWWPLLSKLSDESRLRFMTRCTLQVVAEGTRQAVQLMASFLLRARLRVLYFR
jgi:glycosyltransferase involved in cell wall biosynthesis